MNKTKGSLFESIEARMKEIKKKLNEAFLSVLKLEWSMRKKEEKPANACLRVLKLE